MSNDNEAPFVLDSATVLNQLGVPTGSARRLVDASAILRAVSEGDDPVRVEHVGGEAEAGTGSALLIRRFRLHLNVTEVRRNVIVRALKVLVGIIILHEHHQLSADTMLVISSLYGTLTQLTERQLAVLEAIQELKRPNPVVGYWPRTAQIAKRLASSEDEVRRELTPLVNKVVRYDPRLDMWALIF